MRHIAVALLAVLALLAVILVYGMSRSEDESSLGATYEFGEVVEGTRLQHAFALGNDGGSDLRVSEVIPAHSQVLSVDSLIPAGGQGTVRVALDTERRRGAVREVLIVRFADEFTAPVRLRMVGRVVPEVQFSPQNKAYFFTVVGEGPEEQIELINHRETPLNLLAITSDNPLFGVTSEVIRPGHRYRLVVGLDPAAPAGDHEATITLTTDDPEYEALEILGRAWVKDIVDTSISEVRFSRFSYDAIDRESVSSRTVRVTKHRGTDFRVTEASTDLPFLEVEVSEEVEGQIYEVRVKIPANRAKRGRFEGTLIIDTNDPEFPRFELPITGEIV